jgi:hypothetical protein
LQRIQSMAAEALKQQQHWQSTGQSNVLTCFHWQSGNCWYGHACK